MTLKNDCFGLNELVTLLQLLAQRMTVEDVTTKAVVHFQIHDNLHVATVAMIPILPLTLPGMPTPSPKAVHSAAGKTYDEAVLSLIKKLSDPLNSRHGEDAQVIGLLAKVTALGIRKSQAPPVYREDVPGRHDGSYPRVIASERQAGQVEHARQSQRDPMYNGDMNEVSDSDRFQLPKVR